MAYNCKSKTKETLVLFNLHLLQLPDIIYHHYCNIHCLSSGDKGSVGRKTKHLFWCRILNHLIQLRKQSMSLYGEEKLLHGYQKVKNDLFSNMLNTAKVAYIFNFNNE